MLRDEIKEKTILASPKRARGFLEAKKLIAIHSFMVTNFNEYATEKIYIL